MTSINKKLKDKWQDRDNIRRKAIEEASKYLDEYFPKGNKDRGKALAVFAVAFNLGFKAGEKSK